MWHYGENVSCYLLSLIFYFKHLEGMNASIAYLDKVYNNFPSSSTPMNCAYAHTHTHTYTRARAHTQTRSHTHTHRQSNFNKLNNMNHKK